MRTTSVHHDLVYYAVHVMLAHYVLVSCNAHTIGVVTLCVKTTKCMLRFCTISHSLQRHLRHLIQAVVVFYGMILWSSNMS